MFRQILFTQLRWTRTLVVAMAVLTFLIPAIAWWLGGVRTDNPARPATVIAGFESVGAMLILTSALGAFLVAAYPWMMDAASKHVFALTLPIRWRDYLAMRFGAGALTLLLPAVTLYLGCLLTVALLEMPPTLRAYPLTLSLRFLAASLLAYAIVFALQHIAGKRAATVTMVILVGGGAAALLLRFIGLEGAMSGAVRMLIEFPGPLAIYAADWKLIDV